MSQVCNITGLETHTVQNWVKRKFVSAPVDKKYSQTQFCRILIVNMLKDVLPLPSISEMLAYSVDNELYFCFNDLLIEVKSDVSAVEDKIKNIAKGNTRLADVLRIMITAYMAVEYKRKTLLLMKNIEM